MGRPRRQYPLGRYRLRTPKIIDTTKSIVIGYSHDKHNGVEQTYRGILGEQGGNRLKTWDITKQPK